MIQIRDLPTIDAALNAVSAVLLVLGYVFVRRGRVTQHKVCMLSAFFTSSLFLACYLIYHFNVHYVEFQGSGWIHVLYLLILVPHICLAFLVIPLALTTLYFAFRDQITRHKRIARLTLPIWLYVSVTGVIVYWMLYQLYPSS